MREIKLFLIIIFTFILTNCSLASYKKELCISIKWGTNSNQIGFDNNIDIIDYLVYPQSFCIDYKGNIIIPDEINKKIKIIDKNNTSLGEISYKSNWWRIHEMSYFNIDAQNNLIFYIADKKRLLNYNIANKEIIFEKKFQVDINGIKICNNNIFYRKEGVLKVLSIMGESLNMFNRATNFFKNYYLSDEVDTSGRYIFKEYDYSDIYVDDKFIFSNRFHIMRKMIKYKLFKRTGKKQFKFKIMNKEIKETKIKDSRKIEFLIDEEFNELMSGSGAPIFMSIDKYNNTYWSKYKAPKFLNKIGSNYRLIFKMDPKVNIINYIKLKKITKLVDSIFIDKQGDIYHMVPHKKNGIKIWRYSEKK